MHASKQASTQAPINSHEGATETALQKGLPRDKAGMEIDGLSSHGHGEVVHPGGPMDGWIDGYPGRGRRHQNVLKAIHAELANSL